MGGEQCVMLSRRGPVAAVKMNRPEVHNAFNEEVIAQLKAAFDDLSRDDVVRVAVLSGEGSSFSAGADLDWMQRAANFSEEENLRDARALAAMLRSISECPHPVVARVQGSAFGGGAGLVAASDIAIAAESALFGFTEVRLGLVPATIAPHVVEKIGAGRALPFFLTGERFDATRAMAIGLVFQVTSGDELDSAVEKLVEMLLQGGPQALGQGKRLVRMVCNGSGTEIDEETARLIAAVRSSAEGREGVRAFLEKRKPDWASRPDG